jgi:uncharacterized membrane protein
MAQVVWVISVVVHGLASAAWFGAMFYSLTMVQPRAKACLRNDEAFEGLIASLAQRTRWKVLSLFAVVGASGLAWGGYRWYEGQLGAWWLAMMTVKCMLFLLALGLFCHVSWRLWPQRIFAIGAEIPTIQRRFRQVGLLMLALIGSAMVLGFVATALSSFQQVQGR